MPLRIFAQKAIPVLCYLVAGGILGWLIHTSFTQPQIYRGELLRQDNSGYKFIDPLLACDIGTEDAFPEFAPIKQSLQTLINQEESKDTVESISVYVRSMRGARWFEINGDQIYAPASLLKVFIMMAYYKEAEDVSAVKDVTQSDVLQRQVVFQGSPNPAVDDTPGEVIPHLISGQTYSINEVINQMIIYSDNDALTTLLDNFDPQTLADLKEIFFDLNIPSPLNVSESTLNFMPVTDYAMVFRVLFGATYLSRTSSEQALKLMSQAHYADGLVAGVPQGTVVAHKFGDTTVPNADSSSTDELHDCGIVYYPNHPYLLCVMTKGSNFADLQKSIQDISQLAYKQLGAYYAIHGTSTSTPATATGVAGK